MRNLLPQYALGQVTCETWFARMNLVLTLFVVVTFVLDMIPVVYAKEQNHGKKGTDFTPLPLVISTWNTPKFQQANKAAWGALKTTGSRLEAVVSGCSSCETQQCDNTVGYGGSPDDKGETTLDALLMDGPGHKMGAVGDLRRVKEAARVAWAVMNFTKHSFLVGESATAFALEMGFQESNLTTDFSKSVFEKWLNDSCQPNFRKNVLPNPGHSCGPYRPASNGTSHKFLQKTFGKSNDISWADKKNHDTIGIIVIDRNGDVAGGTSTNGASHKISGRVGDSPIPGAGAYVDNDVGGAASTGDGDVMMRFLPSYQAVENMRMGQKPSEAAENALKRISRYYPSFMGAVVAADKKGRHGAACHGVPRGTFQYCVSNTGYSNVHVETVTCEELGNNGKDEIFLKIGVMGLAFALIILMHELSF